MVPGAFGTLVARPGRGGHGRAGAGTGAGDGAVTGIAPVDVAVRGCVCRWLSRLNISYHIGILM